MDSREQAWVEKVRKIVEEAEQKPPGEKEMPDEKFIRWMKERM